MCHFHIEAGATCSRCTVRETIHEAARDAINDISRRLGCKLSTTEEQELVKTGHLVVGNTWIRLDQCYRDDCT